MSDVPYPRKHLREFILMYKELPCLWQSSHLHYHNKKKKAQAQDLLVKHLAKIDPSVNRHSAIKKINTMRCCYRKEYNKIKKSIAEGKTGDDVHVPSLWYYDLLTFIGFQGGGKLSNPSVKSNDDNSVNEDDSSNYRDRDEDDDNEVETENADVAQTDNQYAFVDFTQNMIKEQHDSLESTKLESKKSFAQEVSPLEFPKQAKTSEDQQASVFGEYVVERLRRMPDDMSIFCRKLINDAIFEAEIGALNRNSKIVN